MSMMANLVSGNSAATLVERIGPGEAGHDDRVAAVLGEAAQRLLALRSVGDLELDIFDAGLGLELLGAVIGGLVERLVELAAQVEQQRRLVLREGRSGIASGQKAKNDFFHVIHTLSVVVVFPASHPAAWPDGCAAGLFDARMGRTLARPTNFTGNFDLWKSLLAHGQEDFQSQIRPLRLPEWRRKRRCP
jgi:hypothetical protein